jgi:hypothetical protein
MLSYLSVSILPIVALAFGVPPHLQTDLILRCELPQSSHIPKLCSIRTFKTIHNLHSYMHSSLLTRYAQLRGITLAPPVLPRRLARVFAGATFLISANGKTGLWPFCRPMQHCWVELSLIAQDSSLQPQICGRALSQSQCGCTTSRSS